jgi:MoaA/NifB/PqqE/SkfB family radical SAM enzyme
MCVVTFDWEKNDAIEKVKAFEKNKLPCWAVVEVTSYCNFNCKWCFANAASNLHPEHMSKEKAESLIEILAVNDVRQVTFSGGEPTLYPYLKDIVRKTSDYGLIVHMNTNGYLLSKELAKQLRKAGLSQVQINIDSLDPKKHDTIRGKKGSFKRAVQALKNAKEAGLTCVSQTVLTKENENEIIDIFKFARSLGIQRCRVWDMTPSEGCAKDNMDLKPTNYLESLKELSTFAYETGAQHIESGDPLFPGDHETNIKTVGGFCVAIIGAYITISYEGDVFFCAII